jgi:hypothetical protein
MNETGAVVLLGLIALGSAVQVGLFVWLALSGLRMSRWAKARQEELQSRIQPATRNLERVRQNLAEVQGIYEREHARTTAAADRIAARARQTRETLSPVVEKIRIVTEILGMLRSLRS